MATIVENGGHPMRAEAGSIHVMLAVRNSLVRYGIEGMLRALGPLVVPSSFDGVDAVLKRIDAAGPPAGAGPAVLVVELNAVDDAAAEVVAQLVDRGVKVLVVVDGTGAGTLGRMAKASYGGGFVAVDDLEAESLGLALWRMRAGELPVSPRLTQMLLGTVAADGPSARGVGTSRSRVLLTPRQRHVLALLVEGLSNKQVARRLGISEHGVKRHVATILAKLNCPNRTVVVARALREDLCAAP